MKTLPLLPAAERVEGRVCWSCRHLYFLNADPGYSEYTPGSDFMLECNRGYWRFDAFDDTRDDFRRKLTMAEVCADFEQHKGRKP